MKTFRPHWFAPLVAVWIGLWQAVAGLAVGAVAHPSVKPCCAASGPAMTAHACCHAGCCSVPVGPDSRSVPAVPFSASASSLPDWAPPLVADFLLPAAPVGPVSWAVGHDDMAQAAPEPLFRRFCALLI